jgi:hypothetical protein
MSSDLSGRPGPVSRSRPGSLAIAWPLLPSGLELEPSHARRSVGLMAKKVATVTERAAGVVLTSSIT